MLLRILIVHFFLPVITVSFAQSLKGVVTNHHGRPVSYATIGYYNHAIGTVSDSSGTFRIEKKTGDSLRITALGHKASTLIVTQETDQVHLILEEQVKELDEVLARSFPGKRKKVNLGFFNKADEYFYSYPDNHEQAILIENPGNIGGYIGEIRFRMSGFSGSRHRLRIRLYEVDSITGLPSSDLMFRENYILPGNFQKTIVHRIADQRIVMPEKGLFVSFQWIPLSPSVQSKPPYIVGHTRVDKSYVYGSTRGLNWHHVKEKLRIGKGYGFYVPSVSISIE